MDLVLIHPQTPLHTPRHHPDTIQAPPDTIQTPLYTIQIPLAQTLPFLCKKRALEEKAISEIYDLIQICANSFCINL